MGVSYLPSLPPTTPEFGGIVRKVMKNRRNQEADGGPSKAISFTHPTSSQRTNFKSKVKEWVNLFLAQQAELSVWSLHVTPDFVTYLEQSLDEVLA